MMEKYNRFEDPKHIEWAKAVKKRDDFTCRVCKAKNVYLHSHHLNSWHPFVEQRFLLQNGITLCANCHNSFHDIYGSGKNTYLQFREFLDIVLLLKQLVKEKYEYEARRYNHYK